MLNFLLAIVEEDKREKIEILYYKYNKDMIRYAKSKLRNANHRNYKNDAYDAVQNTFLKLIKYIPDEITKEKSYVFAVLDNEINKILKDKEYFVDLYEQEDLVDEDDFVEILILKLQLDNIGRLVNQFDDKFRIPMLMKYGYDMTVEQIAEQLDIPASSIYWRLGKARQMIKTAIERGDLDE